MSATFFVRNRNHLMPMVYDGKPRERKVLAAAYRNRQRPLSELWNSRFVDHGKA